MSQGDTLEQCRAMLRERIGYVEPPAEAELAKARKIILYITSLSWY